MNVQPSSSLDPCNQIISFSFLNYSRLMHRQIQDLCMDASNNETQEMMQLIHPYEFIFSKVPGSKYSVSKLKPSTNLFYDLFEIYNNLNFFDNFNQPSLKSLHISPQNIDSIECFEMFREGFEDEIVWWNELNIDNFTDSYKKFDFIFLENGAHCPYFVFLVKVICCILKNQNQHGNLVVKISDVYHKPSIDFIYYLTSLYEKVYIAKPYTNNVLSNDKYVICKQFKHGPKSNYYLRVNYLKLIIFLKKLEEGHHIVELLPTHVPCYFKNKLDELNVIIGQYQLDAMDLAVSLFKNKNKYDKIETIKKNNIVKSVAWCEKYKIPYNKFTEKTNMFLQNKDA